MFEVLEVSDFKAMGKWMEVAIVHGKARTPRSNCSSFKHAPGFHVGLCLGCAHVHMHFDLCSKAHFQSQELEFVCFKANFTLHRTYSCPGIIPFWQQQHNSQLERFSVIFTLIL